MRSILSSRQDPRRASPSEGSAEHPHRIVRVILDDLPSVDTEDATTDSPDAREDRLREMELAGKAIGPVADDPLRPAVLNEGERVGQACTFVLALHPGDPIVLEVGDDLPVFSPECAEREFSSD